MRWTVFRTFLPAVSALVAALAFAQPPASTGEGPPVAAVAAVAPPATDPAPEVTLETPAAAPETPARPARRSRRTGRDRTARAHARPVAEVDSVSVGRHNRGRLVHGTEIAAGEHLRLKHPDGDQHHGTDELVNLLHGASDHVWASLPGTLLTVGDLSRHSGGRFRPHRSHQNGRDVDVGFYIRDVDGHAIAANRFVDFGPMGTTRFDPTWRFDDERNWLFVEHLLTQTDAPVQYMFCSRELRRRLLAEGSRRNADPEILARAARVLYQPPAGGRHRDHFHVRVYCDPGDRPRCHDDGGIHPWLRGSSALAEAAGHSLTGLEDVVAAVAFFSAPPAEEALEGDPEEERPRARSRRSRSRSRARSRSRRRH